MRGATLGLLGALLALGVAAGESAAHHGELFERLGRAIEARDLRPVRHLFQPDIWKTGDRAPDGHTLHGWLRSAEAVDRGGVLEYSSREACAVGVRFYDEDVDEARVFWLLGERVGGDEPPAQPEWRVTRILTDVKEVRSALGRPLVRSHLEGPPLRPEDAAAARPLVDLMGPARLARAAAAEGAWDRGGERSPRHLHEEIAEKGWRCVPRRVRRDGDRAVVRTLLWHVEDDRYVETRLLRLVRENQMWKVHGVAASEEEAAAFLEKSPKPKRSDRENGGESR